MVDKIFNVLLTLGSILLATAIFIHYSEFRETVQKYDKEIKELRQEIQELKAKPKIINNPVGTADNFKVDSLKTPMVDKDPSFKAETFRF